MTRDEFLQELRRSLTGQVPDAVVEDNLRYYASYIDGECAKGRTAEQVLSEIGDPRLIAKTILETTPGSGEYYDTDGEEASYRSTDSEERQSGSGNHMYYFDLSKWYWQLLIFGGLFFVVYLILTILGGMFIFFLPVIRPLILIWFFVWVWKNFLH